MTLTIAALALVGISSFFAGMNLVSWFMAEEDDAELDGLEELDS